MNDGLVDLALFLGFFVWLAIGVDDGGSGTGSRCGDGFCCGGGSCSVGGPGSLLAVMAWTSCLVAPVARWVEAVESTLYTHLDRTPVVKKYCPDLVAGGPEELEKGQLGGRVGGLVG